MDIIKNLKRTITPLFILSIFLGVVFLTTSNTFADTATGTIGNDTETTTGTIGGTAPTVSLVNQLSFGSIEEFLDRVADILFTYSIPLVVIMIIIGAFYLVTAGGNPGKIDTGKKIITWAIIGFVVILIAGSIASLVRNLLEG